MELFLGALSSLATVIMMAGFGFIAVAIASFMAIPFLLPVIGICKMSNDLTVEQHGTQPKLEDYQMRNFADEIDSHNVIPLFGGGRGRFAPACEAAEVGTISARMNDDGSINFLWVPPYQLTPDMKSSGKRVTGGRVRVLHNDAKDMQHYARQVGF